MITESLSTLKIHKLSQAQYDRELDAGRIDSNAIYLTPEEEITLLDLGVTATASELNKMDGVTATTTELNYCDGVTSNIQTQLNGKQSTITGAASTITGSNLTTNRALISNGSGKVAVSAVTSTELGYLDGVTSAIQTQLNGKANTSHNHSASEITSGTLSVSRGGTGNDTGYVRIGQKSGTTIGNYATAEGCETTASGDNSHAEGYGTIASNNDSHAEGFYTTSSNIASHAEGVYATASGYAAHAEGAYTTASGDYSHAEGIYATASGYASHAEGYETNASKNYSHAEGRGTTASTSYQHVQGKYNVVDSSYAHIIGNGTSDANRSNAHTIDWNGNAWFAGDVYVGGTSQSNGTKLATEEYVNTSNIFQNLYTVENVSNSSLRIMTGSNTRRTPGLYLFVGDSNLTLGSHTFGKYLLAQVLDDYTNNDQTSGSVILRYSRSQSMRDVMTGCLYTQSYGGISGSTTNSYTKKSPSYV